MVFFLLTTCKSQNDNLQMENFEFKLGLNYGCIYNQKYSFLGNVRYYDNDNFFGWNYGLQYFNDRVLLNLNSKFR